MLGDRVEGFAVVLGSARDSAVAWTWRRGCLGWELEGMINGGFVQRWMGK